MSRPATPGTHLRRAAAIAALLAGAAVVVWLVAFGVRNLPSLAVGMVGALAVVAGTWRVFLARGRTRAVGVAMIAGGIALLVVSVVASTRDVPFVVGRVAGLLALLGFGLAAGRYALDDEIDEARVRPHWRPVAPARHPVLIVNPRSGDGRAERVGLVDQARERGIDVRVLAPGDDLEALAQAAVDEGADALGMAGGDGSLALVASVAHEREVPFVCVPSGTRNHLAGDLALDRDDSIAALDAFGEAAERRIDHASVNGALFMNNVSLGLYGEMVQDERYRDDKVGIALELLGEMTTTDREPYDLRLRGPDGEMVDGAYLIQVSNNRYRLDGLLDFGRRLRIDGGELGIVVLRGDRQVGLTPLVARAAAGRLTRSESVLEWGDDDLVIEAGDRTLWAGVDGEAIELQSPLRFRIHPLALRVRVPRENLEAAERRRRREARVRNLVRIAVAGEADRALGQPSQAKR